MGLRPPKVRRWPAEGPEASGRGPRRWPLGDLWEALRLRVSGFMGLWFKVHLRCTVYGFSGTFGV